MKTSLTFEDDDRLHRLVRDDDEEMDSYDLAWLFGEIIKIVGIRVELVIAHMVATICYDEIEHKQGACGIDGLGEAGKELDAAARKIIEAWEKFDGKQDDGLDPLAQMGVHVVELMGTNTELGAEVVRLRVLLERAGIDPDAKQEEDI